MVIANPIYDVAFKFLMEDERVAKFFIGTLLEETVEAVTVRPQEHAYRDEKGIGFAVFRLDFVATVKTVTGESKKVLIEIQKAKNPIDLMRFRNYLGEHYKKQDEVNGQMVPLPIVTIYLLGFLLEDIDACVVKVNRQYTDLQTHRLIEKRSSFIERLSHDCFVVQLRRIGAKAQTKLDKLLSIFEQNYFVDQHGMIKEYKGSADDEDIRLMLDKLHYFGTEPSEKKKLEDEQEYLRIMDLYYGDLFKKLADQDQALQEKSQALEAKDQALEAKDQALEAKNRALEEAAQLIEDLKRKLGGG